MTKCCDRTQYLKFVERATSLRVLAEKEAENNKNFTNEGKVRLNKQQKKKRKKKKKKKKRSKEKEKGRQPIIF